MAQSSPMPRVMRSPVRARRRIFSTMASSFMKHEAGGQFLTKDLTHGGEVAGGLGFEVEIRERAAHGFESVRRQVARGVAGNAGQGGDGVGGFGNFEERIDPARGSGGRQDLVDGTVEKFAGA